MRIKAEGYGAACLQAENESKKAKNELWVVKANVGGIGYYITDTIEIHDKVMAHYDKGIAKIRK
jgi:hypothetical protein